MEVQVCPQCGAGVRQNLRTCEYCKAEYYVPSFSYLNKLDRPAVNRYVTHHRTLVKADPDDGEAHFSLALCYLQLKLFDRAAEHFDRAVHLCPDLPDAYYYFGLALVGGRRPKTMALSDVRKIEAHLTTAMQLDDTRAKYHLFAAILKYDYYRSNGLRAAEPSWQRHLEIASQRLFERDEVDLLLESVLLRDESLINAVRSGNSRLG